MVQSVTALTRSLLLRVTCTCSGTDGLSATVTPPPGVPTLVRVRRPLPSADSLRQHEVLTQRRLIDTDCEQKNFLYRKPLHGEPRRNGARYPRSEDKPASSYSSAEFLASELVKLETLSDRSPGYQLVLRFIC